MFSDSIMPSIVFVHSDGRDAMALCTVSVHVCASHIYDPLGETGSAGITATPAI